MVRPAEEQREMPGQIFGGNFDMFFCGHSPQETKLREIKPKFEPQFRFWGCSSLAADSD